MTEPSEVAARSIHSCSLLQVLQVKLQVLHVLRVVSPAECKGLLSSELIWPLAANLPVLQK